MAAAIAPANNRLLWFLPGLVVLCLAAQPVTAQERPGLTQIVPTTTQPEEWKPPDIADLPGNWWEQFSSANAADNAARMQQFLLALRERIQGLGPEDLLTAQAEIENLDSLAKLLSVAKSATADSPMVPITEQETYSLSDVLELRAQRRDLVYQQARLNLEREQLQHQVDLLQGQRDSLERQYKAIAPETSRRILVGINRVAARVEYELAVTRLDNLQRQLAQSEERVDLLDQQMDLARQRLLFTDRTLQTVDDAVKSAQAKVVEMREKLSALQPMLVEALSADPPNPSLELLRKQQITRADAENRLAQLQAALAKITAHWYHFRAGALVDNFDYLGAAADARQMNDDALAQAVLWASVSQATLVAPAPGDSLNAKGNFELAQAAARETLDLVNEIRNTADDLLVVADILSSEIVATQSGLKKAWSRLLLAYGSTWDRLVALNDYHLFNIGDAPVTPGAIVKMLFIFLLAFGISWLIRHLLNRSIDAEKVSRKAAVYALGRLLHYVIMLIGTFAALGSIGIDFTSFALIAGALSVGIGFGLQAIVNNFVSGLILLFEGTLRVGDYVELDSGLRGVVREINTRATIINSNDSVDVVVPNSELVTTKLTNWTLRESMARLRVPFGVAYGSDKELVKQVALEAAHEVDFVLTHMPDRAPSVRLTKFGDNALEFEMLFWVSRPGVRRPGRARAAFLWKLETRLRAANIQIPFPQRDIHLRSDFRTEAAKPKPQMVQEAKAQPEERRETDADPGEDSGAD